MTPCIIFVFCHFGGNFLGTRVPMGLLGPMGVLDSLAFGAFRARGPLEPFCGPWVFWAHGAPWAPGASLGPLRPVGAFGALWIHLGAFGPMGRISTHRAHLANLGPLGPLRQISILM